MVEVSTQHKLTSEDESSTVIHGEAYRIPTEVILMLRAAGGSDSVGKSAVVTLLDWYDLDQEVVLVMERPDPSVDLYNCLFQNGPLEEDQAKNIIRQLLEAAIQMHSEGVFHRDIKSENVLLETGSDVPRVRVIDFGCGCFVKRRYYSFAGTFAYAPPEYFSQGSYEAAPTTVWQLGALLYELLDGDTQFTTSKYVRGRTTLDISDLDPDNLDVTKDCNDFLMRCLALDPRDRATLEELQQHPWFK
ncbi:serine/threonine-protein kinase pim-2-like [Symphorus nematophorus]